MIAPLDKESETGETGTGGVMDDDKRAEGHEDPGEYDTLPAIDNRWAWVSILAVLTMLVLINVVAFLVSFGAGVIVTLPITLFMAFLLLRNAVPRHRLPPGRPPRGVPT